MAGDEDDGASKASEPTKEEAISLIPSQDVASWLLSKNFLLSAYELWFELEDSRDASDPTEPQARNKLRDYFKDPKRFPPQELSAMATQDAATLAVLAKERGERLQLMEYELRTAREDLEVLRESGGADTSHAEVKKAAASSGDAALSESEKRLLNCIVKQYLISRGYRMTAITMIDEVRDQDLDNWEQVGGRIPDALRGLLRHAAGEAGGLSEFQKHAEQVKALEEKAAAADKAAAEARRRAEQLEEKLKEAHAEAEKWKEEANRRRKDNEVLRDEASAARAAAREATGVKHATEERDIPRTPDPAASGGGGGGGGGAGDGGAGSAEVVAVVAEALPRIVPNVLIQKRKELLPVLVCAIKHHPAAAVREALTGELFNLIKKPDEAQRQVIVEGCVALSEGIGADRAASELLPQIWEQVGHKTVERRILVAEACAKLSPTVRPEIRLSLILSVLSQLVEDAEVTVREAAATSLAAVLATIDSLEKYSTVERMLFVLTEDPAVGEMASATLIPAVAEWLGASDMLYTHLLPATLRRASCGKAPAEGALLPDGDRWRIRASLRTFTHLLKVFRDLSVQRHPECKGQVMAMEEKAGGAEALAEQLFSEFAEGGKPAGWAPAEWLAAEAIGLLAAVLRNMPLREQELRRQAVATLRALCRTVGAPFTAQKLAPPLLAAAGAGEPPRPPSVERQALRTMVLPGVLAGVLPCAGAGALRTQLSLLLLACDDPAEVPEERATEEALAAGPAGLAEAFRFLCGFDDLVSVPIDALGAMREAEAASSRRAAAALLRAVMGVLPPEKLASTVLPMLVKLGQDTDMGVRCTAVDAIGSLTVHAAGQSDVVSRVTELLDAFLEERDKTLTLAVIRALAHAARTPQGAFASYASATLKRLAEGNAAQALRTKEGRSLPGASKADADAAMETQKGAAAAIYEAVLTLSSAGVEPASALTAVMAELLRAPDVLDASTREHCAVLLREGGGAPKDGAAAGAGGAGAGAGTRAAAGATTAASSAAGAAKPMNGFGSGGPASGAGAGAAATKHAPLDVFKNPFGKK